MSCSVQKNVEKSLMSQESFEQFRQLVLQDPALQKPLREAPDRETFTRLLLQSGAERGYGFTDEDVENALRAGQRAWLERWVQG